ncbi:unnamed protein product [Gordionus sp. m RMFG-2023]
MDIRKYLTKNNEINFPTNVSCNIYPVEDDNHDLNTRGSIENDEGDVNTPEFKIKHLTIVLTKLKLPVQTTLVIPKRRKEENDFIDHFKFLPSTSISKNQSFNDELDTIGNNLPPISKIPRYFIKKYDKNQLNTVDHFKSLLITSISSITLKKNDNSQKNIIGCINLEFKGIY